MDNWEWQEFLHRAQKNQAEQKRLAESVEFYFPEESESEVYRQQWAKGASHGNQ